MAKSNDPWRFFPFFVSVGRTAFGGLGPCGGRRQRKAPVIGWTAKLADGRGEIAPSVWVTNPRARTFAPLWCGAHITYIISSLCQANANGNRGVPRRVPDIIMAFLIGLEVSVQGGFSPASWRSCGVSLLRKKYSYASSFARQWKTVYFVSKVCKWN